MSGSGEAGSLQRAHALSAQASQLLHKPSPSIATLNSALEAYRQAANLFAQAASGGIADSGTHKTLQLLTAQHSKLVRDLERRIGLATASPIATQHPSLRRAATVPAPSAGGSSGVPIVPQGRVLSDRRPTSPIKRPSEPAGLAAIGVSPSPFFASSTAAPRPGQGSTGRPLPPFAQRPPPPTSSTGQFPGSFTQHPPPNLSPLYSSASSSDPDPAESYITFGLGLAGESGRYNGKEVDPFSRFWGMLEECLDEVSRPVAFASAPLGGGTAKHVGRDGNGETVPPGQKSRKGKERKVVSHNQDGSISSPSDSYYLISAEAPDSTLPKESMRSPSNKTPEELALENESLRASLDALAVHTQQVEKENQELKKHSLERDTVLRTVAESVRKEAEKARLDTSVLLRSQVLGLDGVPSRQSGHSKADTSKSSRNPSEDAGMLERLKQRVVDLEEEVKVLKGENEKQKGSIQRYKDRFDKIKTSARAKREAREGSLENGRKAIG